MIVGIMTAAGIVRQFGKILKRKKAQNFQKKALFQKIKHFLEQIYLSILYLLFQNLLLNHLNFKLFVIYFLIFNTHSTFILFSSFPSQFFLRYLQFYFQL